MWGQDIIVSSISIYLIRSVTIFRLFCLIITNIIKNAFLHNSQRKTQKAGFHLLFIFSFADSKKEYLHSKHLAVQSQQQKPRRRCKKCSKKVSPLFTINVFHTFMSCFYCWFWTSKCLPGRYSCLQFTNKKVPNKWNLIFLYFTVNYGENLVSGWVWSGKKSKSSQICIKWTCAFLSKSIFKNFS